MSARPSFARTSILAAAALAATLPAARAQPAAEVPVTTAPTVDALRQNFLSPPEAAKPMVRWWWFGPASTKPEILRELTQMKHDGIGGAELAFVYAEELDDPAKGIKNLAFLSPEMLSDVTYAQAEGRKLGLRIDVTLGSGWPYGGPATTLAQAVTRLRTAEVPVPAGATSVSVPSLAEGKALPELSRTRFLVGDKPVLAPGDSVISVFIANSVTTPARPALTTRNRNFGAQPVNWDATSAKPLHLSGATLSVPPSDTPRTALFFILSHTGQVVKRASVGAEGWVLDPFSHEAVATHLRTVGEPLIKSFGSTPPYAIFSDSLEAGGADWTPNLPAEFQRRRGYDLMPHLPELVFGGSPAAEQVRHDYGQTLTELVDENYLTQINDWGKAHNTRFRSQTYGEDAVDFSSQNLVSLAEGEWPEWRVFSALRWATSANHVFNHNVTSGETFTWLHSPVFRATPLDMKAEADVDFIMGENQLIFHGWPYSPPQAFYPGWSLYASASFNDNNPWHPVMPEVTRYIARLSYLMRQGQPANQVAILMPTDDVWAAFSPMHTSVTAGLAPKIAPLMAPILTAGYNVDYIDAKAINSTGLGTHQILILPPMDRLPVETALKIQDWAAKGGKVICVGPLPTMTPDGKELMQALHDRKVQGDQPVVVADPSRLGDALAAAAKPDFQITGGDPAATTQLGFIRRTLPDADIYFVANTSNRPMDATTTFATEHKNGESWNPDSASFAPATSTGQLMHLAPYESRVFVFSSKPATLPRAPEDQSGQVLADLTTDWQVNFVSENKTLTETTLKDWLDDPATKNYSGEAIYSKDFTLSNKPATPVYLAIDGGTPLPGAPNSSHEQAAQVVGMHAYYEPPVREAALVVINGQQAGALWHPPYRLDVSKYLKQGVNHIEIHVYNTALNHWASLPSHDFGPLTAKYGDKFQMQDLNQVHSVPSGLMGSIHLVTDTDNDLTNLHAVYVR